MPGDGERLVVGLVRGLQGLRGGVRVEPLSDEPGRFEPGSSLYPEGTGRRLTVDWSQQDAPGLLVRFREVTTREAAEQLLGTYLEAEVATELAADAYWWHEVIGAAVTADTGEVLGTVADVFRAGGGEVYVVRGGPRGELMIPAVRAVFREFAPREGRLVVDADALGLDELTPRRPRGRRSSRAGRPATGPVSGSPLPAGTAGPDAANDDPATDPDRAAETGDAPSDAGGAPDDGGGPA